MRDTRAEKTRSGRHPTLADWILLIAFLSVCFFGYRYLQGRRKDTHPSVEISYTVCVYGAEMSLAEKSGGWEVLVPIGSRVTNANGTAELGRVDAVEVLPHPVPTVKNGEVVFINDPTRADLYFTVRGRGIGREGDGIRISDIRIAAGSAGDYRVGGYLASGARVIAVEKIGEG